MDLNEQTICAASKKFLKKHGRLPAQNEGDAAEFFGRRMLWATAYFKVYNSYRVRGWRMPAGIFATARPGGTKKRFDECPYQFGARVLKACLSYREKHGVLPSQYGGSLSEFGLDTTLKCANERIRKIGKDLGAKLLLKQGRKLVNKPVTVRNVVLWIDGHTNFSEDAQKAANLQQLVDFAKRRKRRGKWIELAGVHGPSQKIVTQAGFEFEGVDKDLVTVWSCLARQSDGTIAHADILEYLTDPDWGVDQKSVAVINYDAMDGLSARPDAPLKAMVGLWRDRFADHGTVLALNIARERLVKLEVYSEKIATELNILLKGVRTRCFTAEWVSQFWYHSDRNSSMCHLWFDKTTICG